MPATGCSPAGISFSIALNVQRPCRLEAILDSDFIERELSRFRPSVFGDHAAMAKLSMDNLFKILAATLTGISADEFRAEAKGWLETAKHPRWNRPYTELTYLPMPTAINSWPPSTRSSRFKCLE